MTRVFLPSHAAKQQEYLQKLLPTFGLSPWILKTETHGESAGAQLAAGGLEGSWSRSGSHALCGITV